MIDIMDLLAEHSNTIIVSTLVFSLFSFITAMMTKNENIDTDIEKVQKPKPKWVVLKAMNYVIMGVFVSSVTYAATNYRRLMAIASTSSSPLTNTFFPLTILWSLCLCYFFGFFGISFLDTESISSSPSSYGLGELQRHAQLQTNQTKSRNTSSVVKEIKVTSATSCTEQQIVPNINVDTPAYNTMTDDEIMVYVLNGTLKDTQLEKTLGDYERAVNLRRKLYENLLDKKLDLIPYTGYDYNKVFGANCEIVIGYIPLPLGIVGPLVINGEPVYIPMATTEGCLVASANRGCKAITMSGGCSAVLLKDAITRAPCLRMPSAMRAAAMKHWLQVPDNYAIIEDAFNSTTNYGRLESIESTIAGRNIYLRFCCMSGDAMGMNMVSKGCLKAIEALELYFPDLILVSLSGNMCTDKKPSAINWILGRGKSVVVEAIIPEKIVSTVLKSSVKAMVETNNQKNHIGSAMAGSIGGFNAHAANIVTALYLATGQDPAQNVESSNCITIMELADDGHSLYVSCTMPSIEVGTVGGGTHLPAQAGCLEICGVRGAAKGKDSLPGDNSRQLSKIVASAVLAGELSLMAALAANHLVQSHMQHNRKPQTADVVTEQQSSSLRRCESNPDVSLRRRTESKDVH